MLDGRTTVLEAARELVSLAHTDAIAELEDRRSMIGIASENDHLPGGEVRKLGTSHALKEKDAENVRAEEVYKADFLEKCRRIVKPELPGRWVQSRVFVNNPHVLTQASLCFGRCVGIGCDLAP
jgi:hypothetical protein